MTLRSAAVIAKVVALPDGSMAIIAALRDRCPNVSRRTASPAMATAIQPNLLGKTSNRSAMSGDFRAIRVMGRFFGEVIFAILSATKNLRSSRQILRRAQNDSFASFFSTQGGMEHL